ncbi:MAG TPA: site-2 protease family protein, partial [Rhodocyclaceae bacterium]|nr:site-2 protease family protein [Rhodocyclaceae bacterium]
GRGDAVTQSDLVDLLVQLHAADLLQVDTTPDAVALFERYRKKRRATFKQWFMNPMSVKLPLVDPDRWLGRLAPSLAWCVGRPGFALWLLVVLPALFLAGQHWHELTNNLSDQVLSSGNLLVLALVFPLVKLVHELGHGLAAKIWGGAVHEAGVMFLVFAPVPYVDASSSAAFPSKYRRAWVASAGMAVELLLAALALYVWLAIEPGVIRAIAFNVMLVAGVSTLVVNGNPLLRYDAYYILCDLIELPNLAQRGQKYLAYLWDKKVFGVHDADEPQESPSERRWLFWYTPLAWCYRVFVTISIMLFIAGEFFVFGVILAIWSAITLVVVPLFKAYKHVTRSPGLTRRRAQAIRISLALLAAVAILTCLVPLPLRTRAEGVVWLPDQSLLRAGGDGFFVQWLKAPGQYVAKGEPLFVIEDRQLAADLAIAEARVAESDSRHRAALVENPAKAKQQASQLEHEQAVLARLEERAARLIGQAETGGTLVVAQAPDMPGRHYKKGELIGYVLEKEGPIARVVIPQDDIDLVRTRFRGAELRVADRVNVSVEVPLKREAAGGVHELPSAALGIAGGGLIPTAPSDNNGTKTIDRVFLVDLGLPPEVSIAAFGERVFVRFSHGAEPLAVQGLRRLRQLFLSRFGV